MENSFLHYILTNKYYREKKHDVRNIAIFLGSPQIWEFQESRRLFTLVVWFPLMVVMVSTDKPQVGGFCNFCPLLDYGGIRKMQDTMGFLNTTLQDCNAFSHFNPGCEIILKCYLYCIHNKYYLKINIFDNLKVT